jgi:hypothetical protein
MRIALLLLLPFSIASAAVPAGFEVVSRNGAIGQTSIGQTWIREFSAQSARTALPGVIRQVAPFFSQFQVDAAIGNRGDQHAQAYFRGLTQGQPVRGRIAVFAANGKASAAVWFDQAQAFASSSSSLLGSLSNGGGAPGGGGRAPAPLQMVNFGAGAIGVPAGWRITSAQNGGVDLAGPAGEGVSLGNPFTIPEQAPPQVGFSGPYRSPDQALVGFLTATYRGQARVRILEMAPVQYQGGQAAYLHYEFAHQTQGVYEGLALVITSQMTPGYWQYYQSLAHAPKGRFAQVFPTMWAMWKSWSLNPALLKARMDQSLATMREIHAIQQGITADRSNSAANRSWAVGQLLQGVTSIEEISTRWRTDVNANNVQDLLRALNRNGVEWQEVPLERINPNVAGR